MKCVRLSFCQIDYLRNDIIEVTTFQGVEVSEALVDEYHDFLKTNMGVPFGILVNKKNAFSYGFSAMRKIGKVSNLRAVAVLHYSKESRTAQSLINKVRPKSPLNMSHFFDRDQAIEWLKSELRAPAQGDTQPSG